VCEQLAQGCYLAVQRAGVEPATSQPLVRLATIRPPSHIIEAVTIPALHQLRWLRPLGELCWMETRL